MKHFIHTESVNVENYANGEFLKNILFFSGYSSFFRWEMDPSVELTHNLQVQQCSISTMKLMSVRIFDPFLKRLYDLLATKIRDKENPDMLRLKLKIYAILKREKNICTILYKHQVTTKMM